MEHYQQSGTGSPESLERVKQYGGIFGPAHAVINGILNGGRTGGQIGSAGGPLGTAAGVVIGSAIGGLAGYYLSEIIGEVEQMIVERYLNQKNQTAVVLATVGLMLMIIFLEMFYLEITYL